LVKNPQNPKFLVKNPQKVFSNLINNELSNDNPFENLLMPRSSDQPTRSHKQITRVREELNRFSK
jgi:hypothetical protein